MIKSSHLHTVYKWSSTNGFNINLKLIFHSTRFSFRNWLAHRQSYRFHQNGAASLVRSPSISASIDIFRGLHIQERACGSLQLNWFLFPTFSQFVAFRKSPESIRSLALELLMPVYGVSPFENISHTKMPYDQTSHSVVYLPKFSASGAVHLIGICFMPSDTR